LIELIVVDDHVQIGGIGITANDGAGVDLAVHIYVGFAAGRVTSKSIRAVHSTWARCVKILGGLATTSLNTGIEVNTVRIHIFVIAAAGLVFGCTDPEPMAFLGDLFEKEQAQQGGEGKPQAAEPADGYIKVEIRGKIIFENGKGYSVSVQLSKDRQCTFSLVIPENKVLVGTLAGLTGKEAIVRGYLDRPGERDLPSPGVGHTPVEFGRFYVRNCEVQAVGKK
jgi:hypothetical protein